MADAAGTVKRFWKDVAVIARDGAFAIELDGRPVRTPGKLLLAVPYPRLADAIAAEWDATGEEIDPRAMALTGLANAAIERISPDPAPFAADLARYGESDLLCYRAEAPEPLVARQRAAWDPLLAWARARYDIHFELVHGIMHRHQPAATVSRLGDAITARTPYELAGLAPIVTITGSLVGALAMIEGAATAHEVWTASQIDEAWQAELWGEDDLAIATHAAHRREFDAAARFLSLLG